MGPCPMASSDGALSDGALSDGALSDGALSDGGASLGGSAEARHWGSLMAGAQPLARCRSRSCTLLFFVEYYVSGLTGAVKE